MIIVEPNKFVQCPVNVETNSVVPRDSISGPQVYTARGNGALNISFEFGSIALNGVQYFIDRGMLVCGESNESLNDMQLVALSYGKYAAAGPIVTIHYQIQGTTDDDRLAVADFQLVLIEK